MKMGIDKWKLVSAISLDLQQINSSGYGTSTLNACRNRNNKINEYSCNFQLININIIFIYYSNYLNIH